jgi:hypothetical protein
MNNRALETAAQAGMRALPKDWNGRGNPREPYVVALAELQRLNGSDPVTTKEMKQLGEILGRKIDEARVIPRERANAARKGNRT